MLLLDRNHKSQVLFVGSFKKAGKDGSVGGQMFASQSLINSDLSSYIDWVLLDSTADSNILPPLHNRAWKAIKRIFLFIFHIIFSKIDTVLIFTADGFSFIEKGLMVFISKVFRKKVILAPRSGIVLNDIANSVFMRNYIPFILRKADVIICQGQSWKSFYFNLIGKQEDKFVIIQNWIDIKSYNITPKALNSNNINVLFLSWVDRKKGILDLINAAAMLKLDFPNVEYHIGGDGMAMEESKALAEKNGVGNQFTFHGWVGGKQKKELLSRASIYVLPSYFEGFPNSLMEAMSCAHTVISTKVGSIPDLVDDGHNGLLFDKGNVVELSQKLKLAFENPELRDRLSKNARNTIIQNNTIEVAINKFKDILQIK